MGSNVTDHRSIIDPMLQKNYLAVDLTYAGLIAPLHMFGSAEHAMLVPHLKILYDRGL